MSAPRSSSVSAPSPAEPEDLIEDPRFRQMRRLVNILLLVMIIGFAAITVALVLKLRSLPSIGVAPLAPGERVDSAAAGPEGITLVLSGGEGGQRIVILDAESFQPIKVLSAEESAEGAAASPKTSPKN